MGSTHNTILQDTLFIKPWQDRSTLRLPGVNPLAWSDWLLQDETFAQQMAYRDTLIINERAAVFMADQIATNASQELLDLILRQLKKNLKNTVFREPKSRDLMVSILTCTVITHQSLLDVWCNRIYAYCKKLMVNMS
jgi:hypothetical protein